MSDGGFVMGPFGPDSQVGQMFGEMMRRASMEPEADEFAERARKVIGEAVEREYLSIAEKSHVYDALLAPGAEPATFEQAAYSFALHGLAARVAGHVARTKQGSEEKEYLAQRRDHQAATERWMGKMGDAAKNELTQRRHAN
jgi:hypothetical protein